MGNRCSTTAVTIGQLPDPALVIIFSKLPLSDRLVVNQVCQRWYDLSAIPWRDVKSIDIGQIPAPLLIPILQRCTRITALHAAKLQLSIECFKQCLQLVGKTLKSLRIMDIKLISSLPIVSAYNYPFQELNQSLLIECCQLEELVWHNVTVLPCGGRVAVPAIGASLKRIQVTGFQDAGQRSWPQRNLKLFSQNSSQLEALIINDVTFFLSEGSSWLNGQTLQRLACLKELCFYSGMRLDSNVLADIVSKELSNLDVLLVSEFQFTQASLVAMLSKPKPLKILLLEGLCDNEGFSDDSTDFAALRCRKEPTVISHVLHLDSIDKSIRHQFNSSVVTFVQLDCSTPEFLAKTENAALLRLSWVAQQILESRAQNADFWNYRKHWTTPVTNQQRYI